MAVDTQTSLKRIGFGIGIAVLAAIAVLAYHFLVSPLRNAQLVDATGADAQYKLVAKVAIDSFSGYAPLRSPDTVQDVKAQAIKLDFTDDGADYAKRIAALKSGEADMAVFTIDTFLKAGADFGEFPGTIVMGIDESVGADGCVAHFGADGKPPASLDTPATKFYVVPGSPSEFLARVVRSELAFNNLGSEWLVTEASRKPYSPESLFNDFRIDADPLHLYCTWQPMLSQLLAEPNAYLAFDTSKTSEYVIDVLVARREFLAEHPDAVRAVAMAEQRANYRYSHDAPALQALLIADAKAMHTEKLTPTNADEVARTVRWTNVQENFARFGLLPPSASRGLSNWTDIITKVMRVLVDTGAIKGDPLNGDYSTLFHSATVFAQLQTEGFNPSAAQNAAPGLSDGDLDAIRGIEDLPALSEEEWKKMTVVGDARVEPISFGLGKSTLGVQAQRDLDDLAVRLRSWRGNYIVVVGHAKAGGNPDEALALAQARAEAARDYLIENGIGKNRIRAIGMKPSGTQAAAQTVTFALMQQPY